MSLKFIKESLFGVPGTPTLRGLKVKSEDGTSITYPWVCLSGRGQGIWWPIDDDGRRIQVNGRRISLCVDDSDLAMNYVPGLAVRARARAIRRELQENKLQVTIRNGGVVAKIPGIYTVGIWTLGFIAFVIVYPVALLIMGMAKPIWWDFPLRQQLAVMIVMLALPCAFWCLLVWMSSHLIDLAKAIQPRYAILTSQGVEGASHNDRKFCFSWAEVAEIPPNSVIRLIDGRRYWFQPPSRANYVLREIRSLHFPKVVAKEAKRNAEISKRLYWIGLGCAALSAAALLLARDLDPTIARPSLALAALVGGFPAAFGFLFSAQGARLHKRYNRYIRKRSRLRRARIGNRGAHHSHEASLSSTFALFRGHEGPG